MNEFSLVCRLLGTLFNRAPADPVLAPVLTMIKQGQLKAHWPLEQDALLTRLAEHCDSAELAADYQQLFADGAVAQLRSDYTGEPESEVRQFLSERGMPLTDAVTDSFGSLLLGASGWKIRHRKMKSVRRRRCLRTICCRGVMHFSGKLSHMHSTAFTAPRLF